MTTGTYLDTVVELTLNLDQRNMNEGVKDAFEAMVEDDGFMRGKKSVMVLGATSDDDARAMFACLVRGGYPSFMVDAHTVVRRLDSKWIPRWTEADDNYMEDAEVLVIHGLWDQEFASRLTGPQINDLVWFIQDAITSSGSVVVLTAKSEDSDLDTYGQAFAEFVEKHFEVIDGTATKAADSDTVKHNRNASAGKRSGSRKRPPPS